MDGEIAPRDDVSKFNGESEPADGAAMAGFEKDFAFDGAGDGRAISHVGSRVEKVGREVSRAKSIPVGGLFE